MNFEAVEWNICIIYLNNFLFFFKNGFVFSLESFVNVVYKILFWVSLGLLNVGCHLLTSHLKYLNISFLLKKMKFMFENWQKLLLFSRVRFVWGFIMKIISWLFLINNYMHDETFSLFDVRTEKGESWAAHKHSYLYTVDILKI